MRKVVRQASGKAGDMIDELRWFINGMIFGAALFWVYVDWRNARIADRNVLVIILEGHSKEEDGGKK